MKILVDTELLKEIKELIEVIIGSPPDTKIKGKIESLAFYLGHHPEILNLHSSIIREEISQSIKK